ncbi:MULTISPECIES: hypothetical protein [Chryseobacterium]|uniref:Energy-coupling factor transporter transmembrane protein EcfT n=1 Tax=Chryseobacterium geocarposphaerae TaxID=1416776 RepID=A0ABU1LEQ5_9FLAO|nr:MULTISPECIES: hypothetical protein [Chryseobacterium]MDR6405201.1 energy-coupling factor transporter transmembrane protein EcfT [Chryseobacterium geocarposphaerae]MDR6697360.1 energy-coupling factor transporter transmembrane protein EcfT [Chryseobacterium ginsenosidimutans]
MKSIKIEIIVMILLWISVIASVNINQDFNPLFLCGVIGLFLSSVLYIKFKDYSLIILLVLLFLGSLNFIQLFTFIRINFIKLNLPITILFALVLYKRYNELKDNFSGKTNHDRKEERNKKIIYFKEKFQNLSIEELEYNLENEHLTDEAKIASNILLNEKKQA